MSTAILEPVRLAPATEHLPIPRPDHLTDMPDGLTEHERREYRKGYIAGCLTYAHKYGPPAIQHTPGTDPAPGPGPARQALAQRLRAVTTEHHIQRHPHAHKAGMRKLNIYRKRVKIMRTETTPETTPAATVETVKLRKRTKVQTCERHAGHFAAMTMRERVRNMVEGGPVSPVPCNGGVCRLFPGTDYMSPDAQTEPGGEYPLTWATTEPTPEPSPADKVTPEVLAEAATEETEPVRVVMPKVETKGLSEWQARKAKRRALAAAMRAAGIVVEPGEVWDAAKAAAGIK